MEVAFLHEDGISFIERSKYYAFVRYRTVSIIARSHEYMSQFLNQLVAKSPLQGLEILMLYIFERDFYGNELKRRELVKTLHETPDPARVVHAGVIDGAYYNVSILNRPFDVLGLKVFSNYLSSFAVCRDVGDAPLLDYDRLIQPCLPYVTEFGIGSVLSNNRVRFACRYYDDDHLSVAFQLFGSSNAVESICNSLLLSGGASVRTRRDLSDFISNNFV